MSIFETDKISGGSQYHLDQVIDNLKTGIWEYHFNTKRLKWSAGFYAILDYQTGEIPASYEYFFENLLYHEDRQLFLTTLNKHDPEISETIQFRLLSKKSGYKWFESTARKWGDNLESGVTGIIRDINKCKLSELKAIKSDLLADDYFQISRLASWEINSGTRDISLSPQAYQLFDLRNHVPLTVEEAVSFFEPDYREVLNSAINNLLNYCRPFELKLLFRSAKNNNIWLRVKALPVINQQGQCVKAFGIFQNIDTVKKKEIEIQKSVDLLSDQNKRLQNFAYIVSHNLRSHTGNLQFMVNLFEQTELKDDRQEIFGHVKSISESLTNTINHLNEIVKIQAEIGNERKKVRFEAVFNNIISALSSNIQATQAVIEPDFSRCPEIKYIPAYLESIFQNMLTNAIKYRHPDRNPMVKCYTYKEDQHIYLIFEDNGLGIDLDKYGDKVFGMYKTFHQNPDAKGIGLFITRNQVEALGGNIAIESTVNIGTKFTIKLT